MHSRLPAGFGSLVLALGLATVPANAEEAAAGKPALSAVTLNQSTVARDRVTGGSASPFEQSSAATTVIAFQRQPFGKTSLYWSIGVEGDLFAFANTGAFRVQRLQDYAARFSLDYFIGAEQVAGLVLRPGVYFQNHATLSAWDIPVDFATGIPVTKQFSGVIGFSAARYYANLVPVAGAVWIVNSRVRIEAVYPEPALVVKLRDRFEARLSGELTGGGFRTDAGGQGRSVEYSSYRLGGTLTGQIGHGLKLSAGAGCELFRRYIFRGGPRLEAKGAPFVRLNVEYSGW